MTARTVATASRWRYFMSEDGQQLLYFSRARLSCAACCWCRVSLHGRHLRARAGGGGGAPGRRRWKSTGRPEKTSWIQKTRRGTTSAAHPGRTRLKGAERPVRGGLAPPPAPAGRAATPTPPATRRRRQRTPRPTKGRRSQTSSRRRRMVSRASPQFGLTGASRCTVLREATIPKEREGIQIRGHLRRRR